jgi:hypothetical protein
MVGVRRSARGPWAFAVRGLGIFASGVSGICLPDTRLLAKPPAVRKNDASNSRVRIENACRVGHAERDSAAAFSDNFDHTSLSLGDQLCLPCSGRAKLRRLPIGGGAGARSIRDASCRAVVAERDWLWRQPPQWVQARVQGEPRTRQGGCP